MELEGHLEAIPLTIYRSIVLGIAATLAAVSLGSGVTFLGLDSQWTVVSTYQASVRIAGEVSWTVWIPRPPATARLVLEESATVIGPVETPYGVMENVTGTGWATIRYEGRKVAVADDPFAIDREFNLSGRDEEGAFWAWAYSSTPSFTLDVDGSSWWSASRIGETVDCGGIHFGGDAVTGWNRFNAGYGIDCVRLIGAFSGDDLGLWLFLLGAVMIGIIGVAVWRWRGRRSDPT